MEEKRLFVVEFGEPSTSMFSMSFGGQAPVYVVARDYNEAAEKGLAYAEYKKLCEPPKSVLTEDGSLNNHVITPTELKVKAVRIVSEDVVW